MKLSLNWLRDFLDTPLSPQEIGTLLEKIGFEVESIEHQNDSLKSIILARIDSFEKHPDAHKLNVCRVNTGTEIVQIVCGASNVRASMSVALALPGAYIPKGDFTIKVGHIRGVESHGMLCGADELGLSDETSTGIMDLESDAPLGTPFSDIMGLDDVIMELSITPNRGDAFSVYGLARDLAAAGGGVLKPFSSLQKPQKQAHAAASPLSLDVSHPGCLAFDGCVIKGVKNTQSPLWMQKRLKASGLRPLSLLVDITNYFTLGYGRPLHVFDRRTINGDVVYVRGAKEGEILKALNLNHYTLRPHDIVIGDDEKVLALGGIMGGADSGCSDDTQDIVLECALFDKATIALSGQQHHIHSDARTRFERGIDQNQDIFFSMAVDMIRELCGGDISQTLHYRAKSTQKESAPLSFCAHDYERIVGTPIDDQVLDTTLFSLGFVKKDSGWVSPSWRHDISIKEDLAEEVLRIQGYETLIETPLSTPSALSCAVDWEDSIKLCLSNRGLYESITWSFVGQKELEAFGLEGLALQNPLSQEAALMRPSLLPSLLCAVKRNERYARHSTRLFEYAPVYDEKGCQTMHLSGMRSGPKHPLYRNTPPQSADVFDAKADVLEAFACLGLSESSLQLQSQNAPDYYHPGRYGGVYLGKNCIAHFGEIHPQVLTHMDIKAKRVACFEIFMEKLPPLKERIKEFHMRDLQDIQKDMGYTVDASVTFGSFLKSIRKADKEARVELFDLYEKEDLGTGKKAFGLRFTFPQKDKTLDDEAIHKRMDAITERLSIDLNAKLRDGSV
jgi:phenylalanyl-tRNA synthetase beta chain